MVMMIKQRSKPSGLSSLSQHSTSSDILTTLSQHSTDTTQSDSSGSTKRVKFSKSVRAKKVMSRSKYTPAEHENTWYDFDELEHIRFTIEREAQQVRDGVVIDMNGLQVNSRGLEAFVNMEKIQKKNKQAREAVFQVQKQYQQNDIASFNGSMSVTSSSTMSSTASADMIATIYAKEAKKSAKEARSVGMNDAKAADAICKASMQEAEDELLERSCENRAASFLAARRQRMKQLVSTAA